MGEEASPYFCVRNFPPRKILEMRRGGIKYTGGILKAKKY